MTKAIASILDNYFMLYITRKHNNNMPMLSAISNELYVNKAFVGLNGSGYQLSGRGYELAGTGVPKRKIKKAINFSD